MAKSKQYQETINLGKKIVKEFSYDEQRDTSLQWMGYYLAELIQKADQEKSPSKKKKFQEECAAFIEQLWERRYRFPRNTRPLANLAEVIPILKALKDDKPDPMSWRRFIDYEDNSPWGEYIRTVRRSMEDILAISLCSAVSPQVLKSEKEWLNHQSSLSTEEKQIIAHLDHLLTKSDSPIRIVFTQQETKGKSESPKDKLEEVFERLAYILEKQNKSLSNLKDKLKPKSKRG